MHTMKSPNTIRYEIGDHGKIAKLENALEDDQILTMNVFSIKQSVAYVSTHFYLLKEPGRGVHPGFLLYSIVYPARVVGVYD